MLKKMIQMNLDDLIPLASVIGGIFVVYELAEAVILAGFKPQNADAVDICGLLLTMVAAIMSLAVGCIYPRMNVNILLKHSVTRKNALIGTLASTGLNMAVLFVLAAVLGEIDHLIADFWRETLPWVTGIDGMRVPFWASLLIFVVVLCLTTGIGALIQRFGKQGVWVCAGAWFAFAFAANIIDLDAMLENCNFASPVYVIAGAAVCLVSLIGGSVLILHANVTE